MFLICFFVNAYLQVEWDDEKKCFRMIAAAIGNFYAMQPPILPNPSGDGAQFYKRQNEDTDANMIGKSNLIYMFFF